MITFTKEQLIASAHARIEFADMMLDGELESLKERTWSIELELARIALASLEAEPVAYADPQAFRNFQAGYARREWMWRNPGEDLIPVYTTPPALVPVPDERYQNLSELYHAQENRLFKLAQRIKGPSFDKYAHSPSQAIDVLESAIFGERADDACHAAMLQGMEPVSNRDELPLDYLQGHKDGLEWAALLAEANHPQTGDWLYDDPVELAKAIRKGPDMPESRRGNSPVIPDGWKLVPVEPTMSQEFAGYRTLTDTGKMSRLMKARLSNIYRAMIAAAPQQELK